MSGCLLRITGLLGLAVVGSLCARRIAGSHFLRGPISQGVGDVLRDVFAPRLRGS